MGFSITSWTYNSVKYCLWAINETHIVPVALMLNTGWGRGLHLLSFSSVLLITFLLPFVLEGKELLELPLLMWLSPGKNWFWNSNLTLLDSMLPACHCHLYSLNNFGGPPDFGWLSLVWIDGNSPKTFQTSPVEEESYKLVEVHRP